MHVRVCALHQLEQFEATAKRSRRPSTTRADLEAKNVLLLGWRREWDKDPFRFRDRVVDICSGLGPGSTLMVVTDLDPGYFEQRFMDPNSPSLDSKSGSYPGIKFRDRSGDGVVSGWVPDGQMTTVLFVQADPLNTTEMEAILSKADFSTAICLGSVSMCDGGHKGMPPLNAHARDCRVLQIMLVLRMVTENLGHTMHIIAENNIDQTSSLGRTFQRSTFGCIMPFFFTPTLVPNNRGLSFFSINFPWHTHCTLRCPSALGPHTETTLGQQEPDFINTQAIIARCLVMNLAYPQVRSKHLNHTCFDRCLICL